MTEKNPEKHQDPAEPYRTDRKVETEKQTDPKEELEELEHDENSTEIMHGADIGVHTNLKNI